MYSNMNICVPSKYKINMYIKKDLYVSPLILDETENDKKKWNGNKNRINMLNVGGFYCYCIWWRRKLPMRGVWCLFLINQRDHVFNLIYIELVHWNKSSEVDMLFHSDTLAFMSLADKLQFDSQRFDPTEYWSHDRRCQPSQHRSTRLLRYPVDTYTHVAMRHTRLDR